VLFVSCAVCPVLRVSRAKVRAALHAHEKNVAEVSEATLAAGFATGHGVGGYAEDLENEALAITLDGSGGGGGGAANKLRQAKPAKAAPSKGAKTHVSPVRTSAVTTTTTTALSLVRIPIDGLSEEGLGSEI
jgi:hypothetical protein